MGRLLPLLAIVLVALYLALLRPQLRSGPRNPGAYRPRRRFRGWFGGNRAKGGLAQLRHADVVGVRDGYSGEPLDPARALVRCYGCRVLYHAGSVAVLARENDGRCAACGGTEFEAVVLVDG